MDKLKFCGAYPVLPTVYSEALSYGEEIGKIVYTVNGNIDEINQLIKKQNDLQNEFNTLLTSPDFEKIVGDAASKALDNKFVFASSIKDWEQFFNSEDSHGLLVVDSDIPGGASSIPAGCTLLFTTGKVTGDRKVLASILPVKKRIFADTANITVGGSLSIGYPEWFGAVCNDSSVDSAGAINKCIKAFPITLLSAGVYYIGSTVKVEESYKAIIGENQGNTSSTSGTRLMYTGVRNTPAMHCGDPTNGYDVTTITVQNICIQRDNKQYVADEIGLSLVNNRYLKVDHVIVDGFTSCFFISEAISSFITNTRAYITGKTNSIKARGYYCKTTTRVGPGAISSLSTLCIDNADCVSAPSCQEVTGLEISGTNPIADTSINGLKTSGCWYGMLIAGTATSANQQNIWVRNCVLDNCIVAMEVSGQLYASIANNWLSCGSYNPGEVHRGLYLHPPAGGAFIVTGNIIKNSSSADMNNVSYGIRVSGARRSYFQNIVHNFAYPLYLSDVIGCEFRDEIANTLADSGHAAVSIDTSRNCVLAPGGVGPSKYSNAIYINASCENLEANLSKILMSTASGAIAVNGTTNITTRSQLNTFLERGVIFTGALG